MEKNEIMQLAITEARKTMNNNIGGPFGAAIVKNNKIISIASNTVLSSKDPTAHAEINAIRKASKKLKTYNLSDCTLYTTAYPCPMCLAAIMWSNINQVYYGTKLKDAEHIGFRDDHIYKAINNANKELNITNINRNECLKLFTEYEKHNNKIY